MKKYSFFYLLMIFACATFATSCSSDDDDEEEKKDPKQEIINNSTPRITLGNEKIDLENSSSWIYYDRDQGKTHVTTNTNGSNITIEYKGKPSTGVKSEDVIIRFPSTSATGGEKETVYEGKQITDFEVLKIDKPAENSQEEGKIWIVATVDGKKLEFVVPFYQEGGW